MPATPKLRRLTPVVQLTLPKALLDAVDAWARNETERRLGTRVSRSQAVRELCLAGLEATRDRVTTDRARSSWVVRKYRQGEEPDIDADTARMTPAERVAMMGALALTAYALRGEDVADGIRRDAVRVIRRRR